MLKQMKSTTLLIIVLSITTILLTSVIIFSDDSKEENRILKVLIEIDNNEAENLINEQFANVYYDLASLCYEEGNYKCTETNCKMARDYYSEASQGYHDIKAKLIDKSINEKIIDIYISMFDEGANINYNMFEACEYFESASRYYNIYYNTNVPSDDMSFDMGGESIKSMNEKIADHDEAVIRYNNLLSEYRVEYEKWIE